MSILDTIPTSDPMPSSGYSPVRGSLDPNDPNYLKKLALVGALEGHHELASQPSPAPAGTLGAIPNATPGTNQAHPAVPTRPDTSVAPDIQAGPRPAPTLLDVTGKPLPTGDADYIQGVAKPQQSTLGKIGHGLEVAGNIAGDVFAPGSMALIPGTQLYKERVGNEQFKKNLAQEQLAQKPELAELRGEIEGNMAAQRAQNQEQLQNNRLADTDKRAATVAEERQQEFYQNPQGAIVQGYKNKQGESFLADGTPLPPDYAPYKAPAAGKPIAGTLNGKSAFANYDPQKGWTDPETHQPVPGFQPPASWAANLMPTHVVTLTNPITGLPSDYHFVSDKSGAPVLQPLNTPAPQANGAQPATSGTGAYPHQIQQANALNRSINEFVLPLVNQMADKGELGVVQGRFSDWLNKNVGDAPPDVAHLHSLMNGVVSMLMGMYGFRRQQAVDELSSQMGARMTPDSLRAALQGIQEHAGSIIGGAVSPQAGATPQANAQPTKTPKAGTIVDGYKFKGGEPSDQKNWVKQ